MPLLLDARYASVLVVCAVARGATVINIRRYFAARYARDYRCAADAASAVLHSLYDSYHYYAMMPQSARSANIRHTFTVRFRLTSRRRRVAIRAMPLRAALPPSPVSLLTTRR